jgi:hypothetical protein
VDRFVASVEKGKSVGRAPVNEEIVEDLLQLMEQSSILQLVFEQFE